MARIRQNKVASLIKEEMGSLFQGNSKEWVGSKLVTVTAVHMGRDLMDAKVYLSIFPSNDTERDLKQIKLYGPQIRNELGKRIRNAVRRVPNLHFYIDDSLDQAERIDELLKK